MEDSIAAAFALWLYYVLIAFISITGISIATYIASRAASIGWYRSRLEHFIQLRRIKKEK